MPYIDPTDPSRDDNHTVTLHRDHWRAIVGMLDLYADLARDDYQDDVGDFRDSTQRAINAQTAEQGDASAEKDAITSFVTEYLYAFPSDKRGRVPEVRRRLWEQAEFDDWSRDDWELVEYVMRMEAVSREERMAVLDGLRDGDHRHIGRYDPDTTVWERDE